jgi:3-methyladenine DNA glycosylase AlkD
MIDYASRIKDLANPDNAAFVSKLTPGKEGILGARVPQIRALAKEVVADDWRAVLENDPANFEEEMLFGLVIATAKMPIEERIARTEAFMPHIDNWSVCDTFCSAWKAGKGERDAAWDFFSSLICSGEEFPMRVSLIARMSMFKDEERTRMLLEDIMSHDNPGYYYRMGAAWAVSVCYVRFPRMTEDALRSGRLCDWTQNKSIQKIRESYRVGAEDKERLNGLKRRSA